MKLFAVLHVLVTVAIVFTIVYRENMGLFNSVPGTLNFCFDMASGQTDLHSLHQMENHDDAKSLRTIIFWFYFIMVYMYVVRNAHQLAHCYGGVHIRRRSPRQWASDVALASNLNHPGIRCYRQPYQSCTAADSVGADDAAGKLGVPNVVQCLFVDHPNASPDGWGGPRAHVASCRFRCHQRRTRF